jgi:hypothetical protein
MGIDKFYFRLGAIFGGLGVLMGAFGAHGLKTRFANRDEMIAKKELPESTMSSQKLLNTWDTAAKYT